MAQKAISTNKLVHSPYYAEILKGYNDLLMANGKVNALKFYREFVKPRIDGYSMMAWYQFLARFKTQGGSIEVRLPPTVPASTAGAQEIELKNNLLAMNEATRLAIAKALNIGNDALQELIENPHLATNKEKVDLLFKAMKATDSRARAKADIRRDEREQKVFDEAFSDAAYSHE